MSAGRQLEWWESLYSWADLIRIPKYGSGASPTPATYAVTPRNKSYEGFGTDHTSFVASQAFLHEGNLPLMFAFVVKPTLPRQSWPPEPGLLTDLHGNAILGRNGRQLRDIPELPRDISRAVESWRVEYWRTVNPHIRLRDIIDRYHWDCQLDKDKDCNNTPLSTYFREERTLNKNLGVWRNRHGILSATKGRGKDASKASFGIVEMLLESGSPEYMTIWPRDPKTNTVTEPQPRGLPLGFRPTAHQLSTPPTELPERLVDVLAEYDKYLDAPDKDAWRKANMPKPTKRSRKRDSKDGDNYVAGDQEEDDYKPVWRRLSKRARTEAVVGDAQGDGTKSEGAFAISIDRTFDYSSHQSDFEHASAKDESVHDLQKTSINPTDNYPIESAEADPNHRPQAPDTADQFTAEFNDLAWKMPEFSNKDGSEAGDRSPDAKPQVTPPAVDDLAFMRDDLPPSFIMQGLEDDVDEYSDALSSWW